MVKLTLAVMEGIGMFKKDANKQNITTVLAEDGSLKNEFQVHGIRLNRNS